MRNASVSQPPTYNRSFSFSNFQAQNPTGVPPGSQIDGELNNVKATLDGVRTNLALVQRDDGALANGSVTFDQLSPALQTAGLAPALPWVTGTAYSVNASVTQGSAFYRCLISHTSGTFATDLAAGNWVLIVDFSTIALVAASLIAVTPSGSLTTNVQTSLQALDAGKAPTAHTHVSTAISDSTTAGRALLTAANAAAQNTLLGTTALGFQSGDVKETACPVLQSGWYYCDGSNKNRVVDAPLFNAITIQQSGTITSGSPVVIGLSDTSNGGNTPLSPFMPVSGTGVPAGTFIQSVDSATQVTLNKNCTISGTTPLVFAPYGVGDGATTFGIPNRAYIGVGRDNASGAPSNINQVSTTISLTSGSGTATVASATGLFVGMFIANPNLPLGTIIGGISGTTITMNQLATASVSASAVRFSPLLDAQTPGATGGALSQSTTLVTANLPAYTPSGTIANGAITITTNGDGSTSTNNAAPQSGPSFLVQGAQTWTATQAASTFTGAAQGGSSAPIIKSTVQPTIVMNYIIKR
jgi:hypothetical protein